MEIRNIGLITYNHPHLKTEQVILRILKLGFNYKIYALPYVPRKSRNELIKHRPEQSSSVHPELIAKKYKIPYIQCNTDKEIDDSCDLYLILGAGILSPECVRNKRIINCHPGIIPAVRGLDAFKWAIYEMKPLGVTLHYIDEKIDAGEIISVISTDVYITDTLEILARRHYENEINVLSDFIYYLNNPRNDFKSIAEGEPRRRMPIDIEKELMSIFDKYKERYGV